MMVMQGSVGDWHAFATSYSGHITNHCHRGEMLKCSYLLNGDWNKERDCESSIYFMMVYWD